MRCTTSTVLLVCLVASTAHATQLPDLSYGLDVTATPTGNPGSSSPSGPADDWTAGGSGKITGIDIWGSWLSDTVPSDPDFVLFIFENVAADVDEDMPFEHPGSELWQCASWDLANDYSATVYDVAETSFYDPNVDPSNDQIIGDSDTLYKLSFAFDDAQGDSPFVQDAGETYWLSVVCWESYLPEQDPPD